MQQAPLCTLDNSHAGPQSSCCPEPHSLPDVSRYPCRYRTTGEEDDATIASSTAGPRQKVAARLLRIEKEILNGMAKPDPRHA